jgi:putative transposase
MRQYSIRYDREILAYCLMTNHVHIIATPRKPDSMARTINVVHLRHAQYINKMHRWDGHLKKWGQSHEVLNFGLSATKP